MCLPSGVCVVDPWLSSMGLSPCLGTALRSWVRHFTFIGCPLSTQVYKWVREKFYAGKGNPAGGLASHPGARGVEIPLLTLCY